MSKKEKIEKIMVVVKTAGKIVRSMQIINPQKASTLEQAISLFRDALQRGRRIERYRAFQALRNEVQKNN